jgi:hypothetical protein
MEPAIVDFLGSATLATGVSEPLIVAFIGVAALAIAIQGMALWGLSKSVQSLTIRLEGLSRDLARNVDVLSGKADTLLTTVTGVAEKVGTLQESISATAAVINKRVVDVDAFLDEATNSVRLQMIRIQDLVETTSHRVEQTVDALHHGVVAPVTEVHAVMAGIRVAFDHLFRRRKSPSSSSHQDEEMFI